jgi:LysR family cys regulon transcriptional activator
MPELPEWRVFCATAKFHSISKAAEFLGIGSPTATKQIAKLEERLGVQLLDRSTRPVQLTPIGERYAALALPLVEGFDSMASSVSAEGTTDPVSVTAPSGFISYKLPGAVKIFQDTFPHNQVRIYSRTKSEGIRLLSDGNVDIALVDPQVPPHIDFQPLLTFERVLITSLGHLLAQQDEATIDEVARYPLTLLRGGTTTRTMLEAEMKRQEIPYEVGIELDHIEAVKRYVSLGLGISVVPEFIVEPKDREYLAVVRVQGSYATEIIGAATLREKPLTASANNFLTVLRQTMDQDGA